VVEAQLVQQGSVKVVDVDLVLHGVESEFVRGGGVKRKVIHDESDATKAVCRTCAIRNRCNNSCGCLNWHATGSINEVSPVLCRYEQMLLPIADRVGRRLYGERNAFFLHKHYNAAYPVLSVIEEGVTTTSVAVRGTQS
jgi:hypothetical protein